MCSKFQFQAQLVTDLEADFYFNYYSFHKYLSEKKIQGFIFWENIHYLSQSY